MTHTATGKRKRAVARVTLRHGDGQFTVNGRKLEDYFPRVTLQRRALSPLLSYWADNEIDVVARVHGGGISAQSGALRHGIARALCTAEPGLRESLKVAGMLRRDPREKERRKAGLKKARKRSQFSKR